MYTDPLLPLLLEGPKRYRAWPKALCPGRITYHPLSWLLTQSHVGDAHVAAYSVPSVLHRLGTDPAAYAHPRVEGGVPMVVFLLDVDCAQSHRATGGSGAVQADDAWWEALRRRINDVDRAHPGVFAYRTRGGARLILRPPMPHVITDAAGEIAWKRLYLGAVAYLARAFGIIADPTISDWPRLIRLPHVTRDGRAARAETLGDPRAVGVLEHDLDDPRDLAHARQLAAHHPGWAPALRILANNVTPVARRPRAPRVVEHRDVDVGVWQALAADLGRALTRHHGRHGVHLALAGAAFARGLPLTMARTFAEGVCAVSGETDDRPQVWETTAARVQAGQAVTGYGHLAAHWPDLAAVIDAALPSGGGARALRDELDARGIPAAIPATDAAATVRAALISAPPGLSVVRVTEGAGKTRAAIDVLRARAEACADAERLPSARKTIYVAPTHAVAAEVAEGLRGLRAEYWRSVLATGACAYHVPLGRLVSARHSAQTWCEGRAMGRNGADAPCDRRNGCPAHAGAVVQLGGDDRPPAVAVTVHALLGQALAWAGPDALVIIDEDPEAVEASTLTRAELDAAASAEELFAGTERWRAPVLRALAAGLERGEIPTGDGALQAVFARGFEVSRDETSWKKDIEREYGPEVPQDEILRIYAYRSVWFEHEGDDGVKRWRRRAAWAPRPSKREHARALTAAVSERFTTASETHATVARLVAGVVRSTAPGVDPHAEQAVAAVEVAPGDGSRRVLRAVIASPAVAAALHRYGPTVMLDATADVAVLGRVAGGTVPVTEVRVADGTPVARRVLYWSGASRKHVLSESGEARWGEGFERYLRAALAQAIDHGARKVGLFTWKTLADVLRAGTDPIARALLDELAVRGVTLVIGHYGHARGRNDWSSCQALVSVGDPRPNVGASRAIAAVLGLSADHDEVYQRATAAELSQVAGRLRAPWRQVPALHVHVGTVAPASWDAGAEVLELPRGAATEVDTAAALEAVHVYGSKRAAAGAVGVGARTMDRVNLSHAGNALPEGSHTQRQVTPSKNTSMAAVGAVRDTLETQRFERPETSDAALIDAAGGAPAVARALGVGRATVYHWRSGARPMPADARARLLQAMAPSQETTSERPGVVRVEAPRVLEVMTW